ncbi:MAG TPA: FtsX-like permease family protein [Acidobacteriaceae bacterium]|jgi:predicted lysophospholipase L1 biosynthesis ABC-type transport system permease subunit|nr:FtsX-like permease family protein [Acidobacteriaceae bacterium]
MIYVPIEQDPEASMVLLAKTHAKQDSVVAAIRSRLARLDPDQPVYNVRSLEKIAANENAFFRFYTLLLAIFAGMALLLALIGMYAVAANAVNQRTREFGIRLALRSPAHRILTLVLAQVAWISAIGIAIGLAIAWPATILLAQVVQSSMILKLLRTGSLLFPVLCAGLAQTRMLASLAARTSRDPGPPVGGAALPVRGPGLASAFCPRSQRCGVNWKQDDPPLCPRVVGGPGAHPFL